MADLLAALVERSLVVAEDAGGRPRYRLLESVRDYGRALLAGQDATDSLRDRHAACFRELAEEAQFIVVTHNKHTMAVADSLFGVTMEELGVSKLVSVRLADLQPA